MDSHKKPVFVKRGYMISGIHVPTRIRLYMFDFRMKFDIELRLD